MRTLTLRLLICLSLLGCGDKDDTAQPGESADATAVCETMCTDAGFSAGAADEYEHELNCFCSGGSGEVTASACTDLCTGLGWSAGDAFSTEACQCY